MPLQKRANAPMFESPLPLQPGASPKQVKNRPLFRTVFSQFFLDKRRWNRACAFAPIIFHKIFFFSPLFSYYNIKSAENFFKLQSSSSRGCGLKYPHGRCGAQFKMSSSSRGCGLKFDGYLYHFTADASSSSRGCGLKSVVYL